MTYVPSPRLQALEGYIFLGEAENLAGEAAAAFSASIDSRTLACISDIVMHLPEQRRPACTGFLDMAKLVPEECFCALLKEVRQSRLPTRCSIRLRF